MNALLRVRIEEGLIEESKAVCHSLGVDLGTAVRVFVKTLVRQQRIPFEVSASPMPADQASLVRDIARKLLDTVAE